MNNEPKVKIICDSVSLKGIRLTTFELEYWRAIHPELLTHRVFSRCARSSRATPIDVNINRVKTSPWGPKHWGLDQKGMTASVELTSAETSQVESVWSACALAAGQLAEQLKILKLHKQIINRILEPYNSISVVLTATDFKNFFFLRDSEFAQPEMRDLARAMKMAMYDSEPKKLEVGEWHLPYISDQEKEAYSLDALKLASSARCARVSYNAFDGTTSIEKDVELGNKLIANKHMSPLEHVATPAPEGGYLPSNFRGWNQYRKFISEETRTE